VGWAFKMQAISAVSSYIGIYRAEDKGYGAKPIKRYKR
jgi:hypothetical protein